MLTLDWSGQRLVLLPERAAWLPDHDTLLVADVHLGKAVAFRRLGVPVPEATTDGTLARLDAALARTAARRIVCLGDLLHSRHVQSAATRAAIAAWRDRQRAVELWLVRGNHDRHAGDPPPEWGVQTVDEPLMLAGLALRHEPPSATDAPTVAGHVHPGVVMGGRARDRLRLPCFHLSAHLLLLPAFGEFTGLHVQPRAPHDRVFAIVGGSADRGVVELPPPKLRVCP